MVSNIATIIALAASAGTALATTACPLSVGISGTTDHIAHVTVTNNGDEAVTVFRGNTVFSDHATHDLMVADADGKQLPFQGVYINHKRTDLAPEMFQTLQPGETVTASVNAAKSYKLDGIAKAHVTAVQSFKYVTGSTAPTALKGMSFCSSVSSSTVAISPDQSKVFSEHISKREAPMSRIQKRSITYSSCTAAQTTSLKATVADAITLASNAYTAAASGADYFTTWFKSTSEESKVRSIYTSVKGVQTTSPKISCTDIYGDCSDGSALLYTVPSDNTIVPCPTNGYWGFDEYSADCAGSDYDRAGSILHETTHLYGTDDYAYGRDDCLALTAAHAAENADTYELYSESVRLSGCK